MNNKYFETTDNPRAGQFQPPTMLAKGAYVATLAKITKGEGPQFKGQGIRKTLCFTFITEPDLVTVNRTVTASLDSRGKLFELVRQLADPRSEIQLQGKALSELLDSFIGQKFRIGVEPSPNGKFNNLISASPIQGA